MGFGEGEILVEWQRLTSIISSALTQLHRHAEEIVADLLEARGEDAEGVVALEAEEQDGDFLRGLAVAVAEHSRRFLRDHVGHGRVAEHAERDEAFGDEARREQEYRGAQGQGRVGGQEDEEQALQAGAEEEPG